MDTTPLYSAEQIVVPEELADILKQYTKAVIRAQPANILEFSAKYAIVLSLPSTSQYPFLLSSSSTYLSIYAGILKTFLVQKEEVFPLLFSLLNSSPLLPQCELTSKLVTKNQLIKLRKQV
jgi:hypothetical protein